MKKMKKRKKLSKNAKWQIKKHLEFLMVSYGVVMTTYMGMSWLNVVSNHLTPDYVYPEWNFFWCALNNSMPAYVNIICGLSIIIVDLCQIIAWNSRFTTRKRTARTRKVTKRNNAQEAECKIIAM